MLPSQDADSSLINARGALACLAATLAVTIAACSGGDAAREADHPAATSEPEVTTSLLAVTAPVYRFAKISNGAYFFTGDENEKNIILQSNPDFRYEGVAFDRTTDGSGSAVFRFANLNNGGYFYTANPAERDLVLATRADLRFEGSSFSVSDSASDSQVTRLANLRNGAYLYTASGAEVNAAVGSGLWRGEGLAFRASSSGLSNYAPVVSSKTFIDFDAPIPNAKNSGGWTDPVQPPRAFGVGNFGGNGCPAVIVAPSYFTNRPHLPIQIWKSDCRGNFTLATQELIDGPVPTTASVTSVLIGDFNKSGRDSILLVDSGLEDREAFNPGFEGSRNVLLLNQGGKLVDVSSTHLPQDGMNFNHVSSIYNARIPGGQTVVLTRLGGPAVAGAGVQLLVNDGTGVFKDRTELLPRELAYVPNASIAFGTVDYLDAGTASLADLDGSGTPYLIAAPYGGGTQLTKQKAVFIYKMSDGVYKKHAAIPLPAQIANFPDAGASYIVSADLEGTGNPSIAVLWETSSGPRLQLIRNDGSGGFVDITQSANVPDINQTAIIPSVGGLSSAPFTNGIIQLKVVDANNDGKQELWIEPLIGVSLNAMTKWSPLLHMENGKLVFMDIFKAADLNVVASRLGVDNVDRGIVLKFDNFGSGKTDLMYTTADAYVTKGNYNLFTEHTMKVLLWK